MNWNWNFFSAELSLILLITPIGNTYGSDPCAGASFPRMATCLLLLCHSHTQLALCKAVLQARTKIRGRWWQRRNNQMCYVIVASQGRANDFIHSRRTWMSLWCNLFRREGCICGGFACARQILVLILPAWCDLLFGIALHNKKLCMFSNRVHPSGQNVQNTDCKSPHSGYAPPCSRDSNVFSTQALLGQIS